MTFPSDLYERAGRSTCDCPGWENDAYGCSDCQDLAANVLNIAAPHVAAREAQAAAKALQEAADECDSTGHHWSGRPALAFFAVASELRDRADRLERGDLTPAHLAPQNHPRSAVDAPEAPRQPGRDEGAADAYQEGYEAALAGLSRGAKP